MKTGRILIVDITSTNVRRVLAAIACLNLALLAGTALRQAWAGAHWRVQFLGGQLDLARENNLAAWYSSMLLAAVAAAFWLCFAADRQAERREPGPRGSRRLTHGWLLLSAIFALLSLDELGSLHERLGVLPYIPTVDAQSWAAVLAVPILVVATGMLAFGWVRVRRSRSAMVLMTVGTLLFLTIPIQEELEVSGLGLDRGDDWQRPASHVVIEEGSELFGSWLFLASGLSYLRFRVADAGQRAGAVVAQFTLRPREPLILVALLSLGLLVVQLLLPHLMDVEDGRGVPQNWFPAVLAFFTGTLALLVSSRRRLLAPALLVVATVCLALSIDHGADFAWRDEWLISRVLPGAVSGMLGAAVTITAAALAWTRSDERWARVGMALWALLLVPVLVVESSDVLRTALSFTAHAAAFGGLYILLPRPSAGSTITADSHVGSDPRRSVRDRRKSGE